MSSNTEWPSVDQHMSLPNMVSSSDLFDGDLFGDELIDIYNSTVEDADANDIPNLLIPSDEADRQDDEDDKHPGLQVAAAAAAMDDGLGAFRPSTSFNDLSTLLNQEAAKPAAAKTTKKRKSAAGDSPSTKKRATTPRGGRKPSAKKTAAPKTKDTKDDTPNPLQVAPAAAPVVKTLAPAPPQLSVQAPNKPMARNVSVTDKTASPVTPSSTSGTTEADFKQIAQVAVSNLILNANKDEEVSVAESTDKVDISTAHIKALTGNNWVAACSGATTGISSLSTSSDDSKSGGSNNNNNNNNNRARRQNLTPDERARQNRDRNREHARNTRLRKKAYVEELKRTLTELVAQRDAADFEKRQAAQREVEQREVRFRVIEEFLKLRGRNEANFARWAAILEDGFSLTLPATTYRKMVNGADGFEQSLEGVANVMADAGNFAAFLQSLPSDSEETISFQYACDRKNFFMDGCTAVLEWEGATVGAVKQGAKSELRIKGMIRGKFSPASNKLISARISFDCGSVLAQVSKLGDAADGELSAEAAAAVAAASQADAILDSLQMPRLSGPVPSAVTLVPSSSSSSEESSVKGEISCDESVSESNEAVETTVAQRRHPRAAAVAAAAAVSQSA